MTTAGLSRAYAVLRQLDVLRAESITNPLPISGDRHPRARSAEPGKSELASPPFRSRGESAGRSVRLQESRPPPPTERRGQHTSHGDIIWEDLTNMDVTELSSFPPAEATHYRGYSKHPYTYAPVCSHLRPDSPSHDGPQRELSQLAAAEGGCHAAAATTSAGTQPHRSSLSGEYTADDGHDQHVPPPPPLSRTNDASLLLLSSSNSPLPHHRYRREVSTERPLRRSPPVRAAVPSPAVLPSLFTSEAARVAAAQASSSLELYFDKDDMHAVLASAAAVAASPVLTGRTQQGWGAVQPSSAQLDGAAVAETDALCRIHRRITHGAHRGTEAASTFTQSLGTSVDASVTAEAVATPSSLNYSPLMAMPDDDAQSASSSSHVTAADGGRRPLWQLPMSRNGVGDKQPRCHRIAAASAASPSAPVKDVSITHGVGRPLGALPQGSRSVGQRHQREATAPAAVAPLCGVSSPPPSGDLSSLSTAAGPSVRADGGRGANAAEARQPQEEEERTSLSRDCYLPPHVMPSPRDAVDAGPFPPRAPADRSDKGVGDDGSGCNGDREGSDGLRFNDLFPGSGGEGSIGQEGHPREDESLPLRDFSGAVEDRSVQRAAAHIDHQCCDSYRPSQSNSRGQNFTRDARRRVIPLFPAAYRNAVPFLDYLERVNAASSHQLLKELAAMREAWVTSTQVEDAAGGGGEYSRRVTESVVVDCLAMDLLLNKPSALECIVVPWLRTRLESMMAVHSAERVNSGAGNYRNQGKAVAANALRRTEADAEGVGEGAAAVNNSVLCAIIGLGGVAFTLLPTLLQLLLWLPPPSPASVCDVRLVGLAIRTVGGTEGLETVIRIVQQQTEGAHVLTAAAYALSTYSFELVGHTSAVCIPVGAMRQFGASGGADSLFQLVPDDFSSSTASSLSASPMMEELRPLWSRDPLLLSPTATTGAPTGLHLLYLQSPPPYRPTHVMVDAEVARCELLAYLRTDQFRITHAYPYIMVLLNDALNARLLSAVLTPTALSLYSPILSQLRRGLHRVLADDITNTAPHQRGNVGSCDIDDKAATAQGLLRLPLLPYSLHRFFAGEKDMLFALESALVHALLARSATALVQEQALMSLSSLPPEARVHVVQPVTDFFISSARKLHLRQTTTMRRFAAQASRGNPPATGPGPCNGAGVVDASENVTVAAAIAAGTVCVNSLASSSCVDGCIAALLPVFQELLHSPLWRVRHAACVGLSRIGPLTADPSSIVHFLLTRLALQDPLAEDERSLSQSPSAVATWSPQLPLQCATVVWCLAQQRQGGVRALLQLLQDPKLPPQVHHWCAFQLAEVDVHEACAKLNGGDSPEADALLDELMQVLGKLIVTQGALEEDTMLLCVRALAEVVHRHHTTATSPVSSAAAPAAVVAAFLLGTIQSAHEAAGCCQGEEPNTCFTVLTSVLEAALLPTNVLKALCLYLCRYGGGHGELYVCELLLQSSSVAVRTAAAFGLRGCGAKALRSVVFGMNDGSFDVRREAFETLTAIGAPAALEVLQQRPAEHRHQVQAALRDCLLQDASRPVSRKVAEAVYRALLSEELLGARELS
ncbi:HEAT repeats, putative [Leishmania lindenbergi]|uniref:HEAT repeat n=1 Tax=Leishmania lindenbergi TaxID=651832 RepID=A0AAW3A824_9TRYP